MKSISKYVHFIIFISLIISCSTDDSNDKDDQKPTISINYEDGFPQACEQLQRGNTYIFKAKVTDNVALSSYSLDMHHNFDHHTHDDQGVSCDLNTKKTAVNPFIFMKSFSIDESTKEYEINIEVSIPNDVDTGDYHCSYAVIDQTGWQSRTSVDIKIIE